MDYDDNEFEEPIEEENSSTLDSVSRSATHVAGKTAADAIAPGIGGKIYEVASNTELGRALEEKVAKRFSFKIKLIIGCTCFLFFLLFFVIFAVLISDESSSDGDSSICTTLPAIDNVCKSITPSGFATMSVDEYVAGVVAAEVGGMKDEGFNTYKAASVAARSYALANATKDGNGNCAVPVGPSFQAFIETTNEDIISAVNETSGVVLVKDNNIVSSQYDALCIESEDSINYYLCQGGEGEEHLMVPRTWLEGVRSSDYISSMRGQVHGNGMSQNGAWYLATDRGWDYTEILNYFYGDEGITLASINGATSNCSSSNNGSLSPLDSYNLGHNGLNVLDRTLTSSEIDELNSYINSEVDKAGYGTGAGVAAAGQALTYWLETKGYYLQYRWGGGHGSSADSGGTFVGVNPNWGSTAFGVDTNNGSVSRRYWGMDCSGFVSWATRTACLPSGFNDLAGSWADSRGTSISLSDSKPGDVIDWSTHVQLIVKNNGDGSVIVAEAAGSSTSGLVFSLISNPGGNVVDMTDWYSNHCATSR